MVAECREGLSNPNELYSSGSYFGLGVLIRKEKIIMSDEKKETKTEQTKPETPKKVDISTPRPTDKKNLNSSDGRINVQMNNDE
jgi:hypothetical protein